MQAQIEQIKQKVQECIKLAEQKFGIKMPEVQIRFDLKGRAAGMAGYTRRLYDAGGSNFYLRFNVQHIRIGGKTYEHLLNDTVPHEVAHTVCQAFPQFGRNHDAGWKRVCIALGGNGNRCYGEADAPEAIAAQRPYVYITTNGAEVRVTKIVHAKIQKGASYMFKGGKGRVDRTCQYQYSVAPTPVVVRPAVRPAVQPAPAVRTASVAATGSKADQIRAQIRAGRSEEECIQFGITVLGMTRTLARTYVKNNWSK